MSSEVNAWRTGVKRKRSLSNPSRKVLFGESFSYLKTSPYTYLLYLSMNDRSTSFVSKLLQNPRSCILP